MICLACKKTNLFTHYFPVYANWGEWFDGLSQAEIRARRGNPTVACKCCRNQVEEAFQCPDCGAAYCCICWPPGAVSPQGIELTAIRIQRRA